MRFKALGDNAMERVVRSFRLPGLEEWRKKSIREIAGFSCGSSEYHSPTPQAKVNVKTLNTETVFKDKAVWEA